MQPKTPTTSLRMGIVRMTFATAVGRSRMPSPKPSLACKVDVTAHTLTKGNTPCGCMHPMTRLPSSWSFRTSWSVISCAEHQNRKRNHPRHREIDTSRLNEVKAPQHFKTRRSHVELLILKIVRHARHELRLEEPAAEPREDLGRDEGRGDQREGEEPHIFAQRSFRAY